MCRRTEEDVGPTVGLTCHRHFVRFFNVPIKAPTRAILLWLFYFHSKKPPDFSRLVRCAWGYGRPNLILNLRVPMEEFRSDSNSVIKYFTWKCIPKQNNHYTGNTYITGRSFDSKVWLNSVNFTIGKQVDGRTDRCRTKWFVGGWVVKRSSIPGLTTWIFRDWLSPASKSRYDWKIAKLTLILKTTNQPKWFV